MVSTTQYYLCSCVLHVYHIIHMYCTLCSLHRRYLGTNSYLNFKLGCSYCRLLAIFLHSMCCLFYCISHAFWVFACNLKISTHWNKAYIMVWEIITKKSMLLSLSCLISFANLWFMQITNGILTRIVCSCCYELFVDIQFMVDLDQERMNRKHWWLSNAG